MTLSSFLSLSTLMSDSTSGYYLLPASVRKKIDKAFDEVISPDERPSKKRKITAQQEAPGGFLLDDSNESPMQEDISTAGGFILPSEGGFIVDQVPAESIIESISLSLIPKALAILGLPPDDPDVLKVFEDATRGWETEETGSQRVGESIVRREDWRAVCAVLLEGDSEDAEDGKATQPEESGDDDDDGDDYGYEQDEDEDPDSESSLSEEDEYSPSKSTSRKTTRKRSTRIGSPSDADVHAAPTATQRKNIIATFSLFFPPDSSIPLEKQRLGIRDLDRVAKLLKEKLTADEVFHFCKFKCSRIESLRCGRW